MKNILKVIVALGVFTMTIGSSFAMDTNPPTEPVKTTVETEVAKETQPTILSGLAYKDDFGNCVWHMQTSIPDGCSKINSGVECLETISGVVRHLFSAELDTSTNTVTCIDPLFKVL